MTLLPGDVISTGTPAGVGLGMKPEPVYLKRRRRRRAGHRRARPIAAGSGRRPHDRHVLAVDLKDDPAAIDTYASTIAASGRRCCAAFAAPGSSDMEIYCSAAGSS